MVDNRGSDTNNPALENDQPIESDVRHLRQWNTALTILGTVVIIGFFAVLGYKYYLKVQATPETGPSAPSFLAIVFAASDNAEMLAAPEENADAVAPLISGQPLLVLEKSGDWRRVQFKDDSGVIGWVHVADIHTGEQLEALAQQIKEEPIKIENVRFIVDEIENFTIAGEVHNTSDVPIPDIRVAINFYDSEGRKVADKIRYINPDKPLPPGAYKSFLYVGRFEGGYTEAGVSVIPPEE